MSKGKIYPCESQVSRDPKSGRELRQITTADAIHHHPFYYIPAWDKAMNRLSFVSHRSGRPQIFMELGQAGDLLQLTDRDDLNEWSIHPSYDGHYVYFTAKAQAWRVNTESMKEECLQDFGGDKIQASGMVGAAMGTTSLSTDDAFWAVPVKSGSSTHFYVIDTSNGECRSILEASTIGHPQFHPDDPTLLRYGGPYHSRIWTIRRDGSAHRLAYRRQADQKEWIVHETWRPGSMEILTSNWPHGVIAIDTQTDAVREVTAFNAWHPMVSPCGQFMIADTVYPDIGLQRFAVLDDSKSCPEFLCETGSSNEGAHWETDHCPYDDGPVNVYAPQHTHPHPNISPDGRRVVFTSDKTGYAQLYELTIND